MTEAAEQRDSMIWSLRGAIKTMRWACDSAEMWAERGGNAAPARALHELAWGFANATEGIENAMNAVQAAYAAEIHELQEAAKGKA